MKKTLTVLILLSALLLSSCIYVSLPESSDPAIKLEEAHRYMAQGQPLAAERLILEAIRIYETENDPEALGNAYRDFGAFLRSPSVAQREQTYREAGFLESSITYDNRFEKSGEYLDRAIAQYNEAANRYQARGRYDLLSMLYYNQASVYLLQNNTGMACTSYDQSRSAYAESAVRNTSTKPEIPRGYSSFHEAITAAKNQAGCQ
ncbi:hypothetical protein LJC19_05355 [Oxalobacter sp. OttesenSCG-928-P03]|nr:hypothetical protein [Oxalobacter sp. OttesenSCG-928-P03]